MKWHVILDPASATLSSLQLSSIVAGREQKFKECLRNKYFYIKDTWKGSEQWISMLTDDQIFVEQCHRCIQTSNYFNCVTIASSICIWSNPDIGIGNHHHHHFHRLRRRWHHKCRKFSHRHVEDSCGNLAATIRCLPDLLPNVISSVRSSSCTTSQVATRFWIFTQPNGAHPRPTYQDHNFKL